jgi:gamma-glutamylputrescine oxidase
MCLFRKPGYPADQVYWYQKSVKPTQSLKKSLKVDVAIIGGGMAGLHAALKFKQAGFSVAVLEHYLCGGGASGKSSGFITPNAELGLEHFYSLYGAEKAKLIWEFVSGGVQKIRDSIIDNKIDCDYQVQDTIVFANNKHDMKELVQEHEARLALQYKSTIYNATTIKDVVGSTGYVGGNRYGNTFGINPYAYLQGFKDVLLSLGVQIYEETPVLKIDEHAVETVGGVVTADKIIVCADRYIPELKKMKKEIYRVQTSLMISSPLSSAQIKKIFPDALMMAWDTDLVYQYFRLTGDNRLLLGGGSMWSSYWPWERHNAYSMYTKLLHYWQKKFPEVPVNFEYMWPGLIGVSKDLMPIAGRDKKNSHIYYVGAATGLPWAAALGSYSAEHMVNNRTDLDELFSPYRSFLVGGIVQSIIGNPITFGLSNFYNLKVRGMFKK